MTLWDEIRFPFDPELQNAPDLAGIGVDFSLAAANQRAEELYECDAGGAITVTIANQSSGHSQTFRLGRWSQQQAVRQAKSASHRKKVAAFPATASN